MKVESGFLYSLIDESHQKAFEKIKTSDYFYKYLSKHNESTKSHNSRAREDFKKD